MIDVPPPKLYKYQSCNEYTFNNLRKGCLWFAKPQSFNDPFDCDVNFQVTDVTQENLISIFNDMRKTVPNKKEFDRKYIHNGKVNALFESAVINASLNATNEVKKKWLKIGVTCFSEKNDDILMWSHYSSSHHGFCLEFDTRYSPFIEQDKETLIKVDYSDSYPQLDLREVASNKVSSLPKRMLGVKSSHWSYECEWRIFSDYGGVELPYESTALAGIYLGCNISGENKKTLRSILGTSITFYEMQKSKTEFKVTEKEIR